MRSPLNKRLFRELRGEFGKYLVIFILMTLTIGMVSGFLVADGSMIQAYEESFEKYNIENGHFRTEKKMNNAQIQDIEDLGIKLYENYYVEEVLKNGSTMSNNTSCGSKSTNFPITSLKSVIHSA